MTHLYVNTYLPYWLSCLDRNRYQWQRLCCSHGFRFWVRRRDCRLPTYYLHSILVNNRMYWTGPSLQTVLCDWLGRLLTTNSSCSKPQWNSISIAWVKCVWSPLQDMNDIFGLPASGRGDHPDGKTWLMIGVWSCEIWLAFSDICLMYVDKFLCMVFWY